MAKITSPVEGFTGKRANVSFVDGKAETDHPSAIAYFRRHGYKVESGGGSGELRGKALDEALDAAGLSKDGTADEKRARLAEHQASQA